MLLSISLTHPAAADFSYLLHKRPDRFQSFDLSFGRAHVFYPEVTAQSCTACLLLDVDPVDMVRGHQADYRFSLAQYVNDRVFAASSFMSVAISNVFGSALNGQCKDRPELLNLPLPLSALIDVLPVRGGEVFLRSVFEPLGYEVEAKGFGLDKVFPEWGESPYFSVCIRKTTTLAELLTHIYVLIPVFDNQKHYFVGEDELEKLLAKGSGWLEQHPRKDEITRRYLGHRPSLFRAALARLAEDDVVDEDPDDRPVDKLEAALERPLSLNEQRIGTVLAALRGSGGARVLDLGCGEGKLLQALFADRQFERIVGVDVSVQSLQGAIRRLNYDRMPDLQKKRLELMHGSLMYRDKRMAGFDAAAIVEVIEHLDPPRLLAFERVVFEFARPTTVVLTTPNREYNVTWETLPAGTMRHSDHRFEWTRQEFQDWAAGISDRFGYAVRFQPIGPEDPTVGSATQMAVFQRA